MLAKSLSTFTGACSSVAPIKTCSSTTRLCGKFSRNLSMAGEKIAAVQQQSCHASLASAAQTEVGISEQYPTVSIEWLHDHISDANVKVLDASWYMPFEKRNPLEEYMNCHIPGALFFDIDAISDPTVDLPHMLLSEAAFSAAMSALGLKNTDTIVVYDGKGIFSSARAWWMFKVFGHKKVYVLDGGLPQWSTRSLPLDTTTSEDTLAQIRSAASAAGRTHDESKVQNGTFKASLQVNLVWSIDQVRRNIVENRVQLVDARSKARFDGTVEEPRKGIRPGHIPGSKCLPFTEVLENGLLLPSDVLEAKFKQAGLSLEAPIAVSCGTGVTACILALALHTLGIENVPVYDGSFTEWGGRDDTHVEKGSHV